MSAESDRNFIIFSCECGQKIKVPAKHAGMKGRCKACGRKVVVPVPEGQEPAEAFLSSSEHYVSPQHRRDLEGTYSEEDLITYPTQSPVRKEAVAPAVASEREQSLFETLGEILNYPVSDKLATQIFLTGAVLFSPLVWKVMIAVRYIRVVLPIPCIIDLIVLGLQLIMFIAIISLRLMYFSYLLLIIEKSAEGSKKIPELPVFQTWEQHFKDLLRVLAASAVAFSPFLAYAAARNIELISGFLEAQARGEAPGADAMSGAFSSLGALVLLYAIAAFYMPMVLMTLVVTRRFGKAVNPVFIFRSILSIAREYLVAMLIIFLFLRGSLTLFKIVSDLLASDWFAVLAVNIAEPIIEFYVLVITMHVIGLLYYRNGDRLQW